MIKFIEYTEPVFTHMREVLYTFILYGEYTDDEEFIATLIANINIEIVVIFDDDPYEYFLNFKADYDYLVNRHRSYKINAILDTY
jgi:hypothetical protein